jgi:uracil-DNA glycosylase family 4
MIPDRTEVYKLISEIRNSLDYLSKTGCQGFDCSFDCLERVMKWGGGGDGDVTPVQERLEDINQDLDDCKRCRLSKNRYRIVFGTGNPDARLMFVGEGPGSEEDQQGEPFVGAAGNLLTKIITAMKHTRDEVYICNIIKCRPPANRNPEPDEIDTCLPFLRRQVQAVQPEFIVALGAVATQTLLDTNLPISRLRGRFHDYQGIKVMPTYHPAFLLRNAERKRDVWEDMKKLMKEMGIE